MPPAAGRIVLVALACVGSFVTTGFAVAACPQPDALAERIAALGLERAARTERFGLEPPLALYREAARKPGQIVGRQDGHAGFAVAVIGLPIEALWSAINDDAHHATAGDYLSLRRSNVVEGTPRGERRVLFQSASKWGLGRWWVIEITMSRKLYEASAGVLWEYVWDDRMDGFDPSRPPLADWIDGLSPIRSSEGAWLLGRIDEGCTLAEYYGRTEPGGVAAVAQSLLGSRALRMTLDGMTRLAAEHLPAAHAPGDFVRPDGVPVPSVPVPDR